MSAILFLIIVSFYFFHIGSFVGPITYTFQDRVTYQSIFDTHLTTDKTDSIIILLATIGWFLLSVKDRYKKAALTVFFLVFLFLQFSNHLLAGYVGAAITFPFILVLIVMDKLRNKKILEQDVQLSALYITIAAIILAALGIASLLFFVIAGATNNSMAEYPYALYQQLFSLVTPIFMAVLIFCIPIKIILSQLISKMQLEEHRVVIHVAQYKIKINRIYGYLALCMLLGFATSLIPHLVNSDGGQLGVDSRRYAEWLSLINNQTENPVYFTLVNPGDRPLTIIILFLIAESSGADSYSVVEYSPLFLNPLLILVTFYLTRQLTANDRISIIAAFLSAVSFQTLVGIYSGIYANWLAIIFGYLAFALMVNYLKKPSRLGLAALAVVLAGVLLAHTYTWTTIVAVSFVFLVVLQILHFYPRQLLVPLYLILLSSIVIDILRSSLTGSTSGLEADVSIGSSLGFGFSQFGERLKTLAEIVQTYYGGAYANIAILGLAIYWLIRCKVKVIVNIFVMIFLSSALVPLFFGEWVVQSRVLYNIPFQIPAAIALYSIWKGNHKVIFVAIILVAFYLSFHFLTNLVFVPPKSPLSLIQ